uniref:Aggregate spidroin 2 n=1 Tax=Latrodectus geometricus TaxID=156851 RepID=A0A514KFQ7_LATGE|nr:aggregate spidroin 2 [Latrodectus geometricus]
MGCSAVAILALCLISINFNVQTFAQEDTDPFDFNETNEEFGRIFVNNLIESGVFGQTDDKDFNAVTESLLNAIQMLSKGQNAPVSTKKTFMMAFASSLAELIVQESDNALTLVEKTRAVTDAMRKAYMQTSGNPNEALIQKVDFLVGIFLDVQQNAPEYDYEEYDTVIFEDEMPLPLPEIIEETLPNIDPLPGHPEMPPEVTSDVIIGPGNDMDEPETFIGEVDKMIKLEQDAFPNAPEEQIQQIMLPGMSQPGEDDQKIVIPDSFPLESTLISEEEFPIPSSPVLIPSLKPFDPSPFPMPRIEPIDEAPEPIMDPFPTPAISPPKLEEPIREETTIIQETPSTEPEPLDEQVINLAEPQISPTKDLIGPFGMPGQLDMLNQPQIYPTYPYPMTQNNMPEKAGNQDPYSNPALQNLMKKFNPSYLFGSPYQNIGLNEIEQTFNVVLRNGETYIPAIMSAIIESRKTAPQTLDLSILVKKLSALFSDMTVENFYLSRTEVFIELILETLISSLEIIRMADESCLNKVSAITSPYKYVNAFNDILF